MSSERARASCSPITPHRLAIAAAVLLSVSWAPHAEAFNSAQLGIIKRGAAAWNSYRVTCRRWKKTNRKRYRKCRTVDLSQANLLQSNLKGANLSGANLAGVTLRLSNLSNANLSRANLSKANLQIANLRGADLRGANLTGASIVIAKLEGAKLEGANLTGAGLSRAKLKGATYDRTTKWPKGFDPKAAGAIWVVNGCAIKLKTSCPNANLSGANLAGATLRLSNLSNANLSRANLSKANLQIANLRGADLRGANLTGASIVIAKLEGANLEGAALRGASLTRAKLRAAKLKGAKYDRTTNWPAGFDPVRAGAKLTRTAPGQRMQVMAQLPGGWRKVWVYKQSNGQYRYGGDVMLSSSAVKEFGGSGNTAGPGSSITAHQDATVGGTRHWPDGVIPYTVIDSGATHPQAAKIHDAAAILTRRTNLTIRQKTSSDQAYVLVRQPNSSESNCFSNGIGKQTAQPQVIGLNVNGCGNGTLTIGSIMHEFLHVAGIEHEMGRSDRDQYITINDSALDPDITYQFENKGGVDLTPFDYDSIMFYGAFVGSTLDPTMNYGDAAIALGKCAGIGLLMPLSQCDVDKENWLAYAKRNYDKAVIQPKGRKASSYLAMYRMSHVKDLSAWDIVGINRLYPKTDTVVMQRPEIVLYENKNYRGLSYRLTASLPKLKAAKHRDGNWNDRVSSVRVLSGHWKLCKDTNYKKCPGIVGPGGAQSDGGYPNPTPWRTGDNAVSSVVFRRAQSTSITLGQPFSLRAAECHVAGQSCYLQVGGTKDSAVGEFEAWVGPIVTDTNEPGFGASSQFIATTPRRPSPYGMTLQTVDTFEKSAAVYEPRTLTRKNTGALTFEFLKRSGPSIREMANATFLAVSPGARGMDPAIAFQTHADAGRGGKIHIAAPSDKLGRVRWELGVGTPNRTRFFVEPCQPGRSAPSTSLGTCGQAPTP